MDDRITKLISNIEQVIVGKTEPITKIITAMLCEGHVLIEDVPGVGKTQLVSALARSVDGKFNRIQLTPDVMPSDIVGFSMVNQVTRELEYKEGAAVCNFLLADEINRASPKSQSSLLEVMEEHQISIDGQNAYPAKAVYDACNAEPGRDLRNLSPSRSADGQIHNEDIYGLSFL